MSVAADEFKQLRRLAERAYGGISGQQVRENPYLTIIDNIERELARLMEQVDGCASCQNEIGRYDV